MFAGAGRALVSPRGSGEPTHKAPNSGESGEGAEPAHGQASYEVQIAVQEIILR